MDKQTLKNAEELGILRAHAPSNEKLAHLMDYDPEIDLDEMNVKIYPDVHWFDQATESIEKANRF